MTVSEMDKIIRLEKQDRSNVKAWGMIFERASIEISLPEFMQGLKTLVSIDWVVDLGKEIRDDILPNLRPSSDDHADWELGEPPDRWRKTVKMKKFLEWWPVYLGYNVLESVESVTSHKHAMLPLYTVALHHIVREDLVFTMQPDLFGQALENFMRYKAD